MNFNDLTGKTIGRLTVLHRGEDKVASNGRHRTMWVCRCSCGNVVTVQADSLNEKHGNTRSCGCLASEIARNNHITHGDSSSALYDVWRGMKTRCLNAENVAYSNYGGRGIKLCEDWENSYESFMNWSMENGYQNGMSIDRIDNDGGYNPQNCRWTSSKEQANSRRTNRVIEYNGESHTLTQWAEILHINPKTLFSRIYSGWSIDRALSVGRI